MSHEPQVISQQSQAKVKVCVQIISVLLDSSFPPYAKHMLGCGSNNKPPSLCAYQSSSPTEFPKGIL